ncbi:MAG TPA: nitroreductase/quinone reductase family protein [Candidatus Bathyarchaeia archaeon]
MLKIVMAISNLKKALDSTEEVEITVTGRKSGRKIALPVWFVRQGGRLLLLPVRGSESNWYKNVLHTPSMSISAAGTKVTVTPKPSSDRNKVKEVADKFRAKYGAGEVKKYYLKFDTCVEVALP